MSTRSHLAALYGDVRTGDGKLKAGAKNNSVAMDRLRVQKQEVLREMQLDYSRLKASWAGNTQYDGWFAHSINNAHLNSVAAYYDFVPGFEQLLAAKGGDMEQFYQAAERLSKRPKQDRHEQLRTLARARRAPGTRAQDAQRTRRAG
jgi:predicted aminopeptidase